MDCTELEEKALLHIHMDMGYMDGIEMVYIWHIIYYEHWTYTAYTIPIHYMHRYRDKFQQRWAPFAIQRRFRVSDYDMHCFRAKAKIIYVHHLYLLSAHHLYTTRWKWKNHNITKIRKKDKAKNQARQHKLTFSKRLPDDRICTSTNHESHCNWKRLMCRFFLPFSCHFPAAKHISFQWKFVF